jgi:hypothetical protein
VGTRGPRFRRSPGRKNRKSLSAVADNNPLVVGKSLGSRALPSVAKRGWSGIWLTPLLNHSELVAALPVIRAKTLIIGGTADETWNGEVAKSSGQQLLEIPGADHGLEIPGDPAASVRLLGEIVSTIGTFLEDFWISNQGNN